MKVFQRDEIEKKVLPGRALQWAIGQTAFSASEKMTIGFAHYSVEAGPMEPHKHSEEGIYVIDAKDGWLEWGPGKDEMVEKAPLAAGTLLHVPADEWHVFRYAEGGFVDIVFVYAPAP